MNGFDAAITREVPIVERQDPLDAMYPHGSDQSSIVHLNARDVVRD